LNIKLAEHEISEIKKGRFEEELTQEELEEISKLSISITERRQYISDFYGELQEIQESKQQQSLERLAFLEAKEKEHQEREQAAKDEQLKQIALRRAATKDGKEVIRAETSKELEDLKNIWDEIKLATPTYSEIKAKTDKTIDRIGDGSGNSGGTLIGTGLLGTIPIVSTFATPAMLSDAVEKTASYVRREARCDIPTTVQNIIADATIELEHSKRLISEKIGKLITKREKEVKNALVVIGDLETLNAEKVKDIEALQENLKELEQRTEREITELRANKAQEIKDLQAQAERETQALQASIKELNKKLQTYELKAQEYKQKAQTFYQQSEKTKPKAKMENPETRETELTARLGEALHMGKIANDG